MKKYLFPLVLLFSGVFPSGYGEGFDLSGLQPPAPYGVFSTMSANTPGKGRAAVAFSAEKSGRPDFFRLSTHLAYGITDNIEFSVSIPYVEDSVGGLEDMAFGIKHRFFNEGRYGPSVAYVLTASANSGIDELSTDGRIGAGIAFSKRVGPVYGHANIFYARPGKSVLEDEVRLSAGLDFSAAHDFRILGEFYGRKSHYSKEIDQLDVRFGYRFLTRKNLFTTLGVGFGIKDRTPEYRLMASMTILFPRKDRPIRKVYEEGG